MASQFVQLPVPTGGGGGGGAVDSFNGRTGVVVSQAGDYSATLISNTPAGTISSTNVQAAINELDSDVQTNAANIAANTAAIATKQPLDAELTAIAALATDGFVVKTGAGTAATRSLTAGSNIAISNANGIAANPSISLTGIVPIANGGLGINTIPVIGALPIGTGSAYASAQLTAGSGITINNAAGAITIALSAPINQNVDGGNAASVYGGTTAINGGTASA